MLVSLGVSNISIYARPIPSSLSVNMKIPSWYKRNDVLIGKVHGTINVLLAHYGTDERLEVRAKIDGGIRRMLANEKDWPTAIIAFKEREETIMTEYEEVISGKRKESLRLYEAQVRDIQAIKEQFGIK
ncbi:MAG: hypothetical protein LBS34_01930 [Rickettsiales bacterium]|jgi:hypothetical protein|nr:hypothetical protein [Rickettsiales bacterium]